MLLISCAELNALRPSLFPPHLQHCAELLQFVPKKQHTLCEPFFAQLAKGALPTAFHTLFAEPRKAHCSLWQRYWLNGFLMHWTLLLHKHGLHLGLNGRNTAFALSPTGKIKGCYLNLGFTPLSYFAPNADFRPAYQQLQDFLAPTIHALTVHSGLNARVFWHNAANVVEFCLKLLEKEGKRVGNVYAMLFHEKTWGARHNPFYRAAEYVDFPHLPLPQPVRFRKVCCHRHLIETLDYCLDCPKLKKLPPSALAAYCVQNGLS